MCELFLAVYVGVLPWLDLVKICSFDLWLCDDDVSTIISLLRHIYTFF